MEGLVSKDIKSFFWDLMSGKMGRKRRKGNFLVKSLVENV